MKQGRDADEIAEILDTTEEYVRRAYYYYKENPNVADEEYRREEVDYEPF